MVRLALRVHGVFILFILINNCATNIYQKMALENPEALVALEDSLSRAELSSATIRSLIMAHNTIGNSALESDDYGKAIMHFSNAMRLSKGDSLSRYNLLIAEGHSLYKKGKKNGIWDAIQKYNKAAQLKPDEGDAHYYIGRSYHKIGDTDFDLVIESYEKALRLSLSPELRKEIEAALSLVIKREKKLKDFWK